MEDRNDDRAAVQLVNRGVSDTMAGRGGWDGVNLPYVAPSELLLSRSLALHDDADADVDPVSFEVIRNSLWTINEEHADTIKRVSGSPVVLYADDLNTSIQTEIGEPVMFAPYIQYFTGVADLVVQWTLENRSDNPGIRDGDVFFQNDPMLGVSHEMDVQMFAPIFVDGRLFCWVFNSCHMRDVGGVEPGSFCAQATDVYAESTPVPPVKLVEAGVLRADVEALLLRKSRIPGLIALDFRSQLAGIHAARERVLALVERYGASTIKGVMRKVITDTDSAVAARLRELPDGTWRDISYAGCSHTGDRGAHKLVLTMKKEGDRLTFSNEGTDAQIGSWNCGYGVWRAAIGSSLSPMLAWDHRWCLEGVFRRVTFESVPSTMSSSDRDGACSGTHAALFTIYQSAKVISKMLATHHDLKRRILGTSAVSTSMWTTHSGIDQWGSPYASVTLDEVAGGLGAFSFRDGVDQGGAHFWPKSEGPDCEAWEQYYPILYLYRRSFNGFGHGRYRGGAGLVFGWTGHGTATQNVSAIGVASSLPVQLGLSGGHWGQTGYFYGNQNCGISRVLDEGGLPSSTEDLRKTVGLENVPAKTVGVPLGEDDVWVMSMYGGGGYGDPLRREPDLVRRDVEDGAVTEQLAHEVYGVVLSGRDVDHSATQRRREDIRLDRLRQARSPQEACDERVTPEVAEEIMEVGDGVHLVVLGSHSLLACSECGHALSPGDGNYKRGASCLETALDSIDPDVFPPGTDIDDDMVYRMYLCPGCGLALENELVRVGDEPTWDVQLDLDGNGRPRRDASPVASAE